MEASKVEMAAARLPKSADLIYAGHAAAYLAD